MKIVIDIPEKWYRWAMFNKIENGSMVSKGILDAVGRGTPLPKKHGRLIDESEINKCYLPVNYLDVRGIRTDAPTIIEADKEE